MIIRNVQLDTLSQSIDKFLVKEFAEKVVQRFPEQTGSVDNLELFELIDNDILDARNLEITDNEDIFRFLCLRYLINFNSPLAVSLIIRILNNLSMSATKRLDFIEEQILNRDF